jgi:hypothetical protein
MKARGVWAALLVVGCSSSPEERLGEAPLAVNGEVDSAEQYPMVVGLVTKKGQYLSRCSGTLVAPNLVLTARHCIADSPGGFVTCGQAPLGAAYPPDNVLVTQKHVQTDEPADYVSVSRTELAPGGDDTCGFDFAAVVLVGTGFGSGAPTAAPRLDDPVAPGELVTAVGYGNTGSGSIGTRRFKLGVAVSCVGSACGSIPAAESEWVSADDAFCQNDSGAAALDAQGRLVGTVSRGINPCTTPVLGAMPAWKAWLRKVGAQAAAEGGYAPPAWVTGSPPPPVDAGADAPLPEPTVSARDDGGGCAASARRTRGNHWLLSALGFLFLASSRGRRNRL